MKSIKKYLLAAVFVCVLAFSSNAGAQGIPMTYCDAGGNPIFCDGVTLSFNGGSLTVTGNQTGCTSGSVAGGIVIPLDPPGIGAAFGYNPDATYFGLFPTTEISLTSVPPRWRHIAADGTILNAGQICFGAPPVAAAGNPTSAD